MINVIWNQGKIWKRRTKNLTTGKIECQVCGKLVNVPKLTDKHFKEEYLCRSCKKDKNELEKVIATPKPKKVKHKWAVDCPHKNFFGCKYARECMGCYYNPDMKIALMPKQEDDPNKTKTNDWFYGNKVHSKKALKMLDDIKKGKGVRKGGHRCYFKHSKKDDYDY